MHGYRFDDEPVERVFGAAARHRRRVFVALRRADRRGAQKLGLPSRFDIRLGDPLAIARIALGVPGVPVIIPHFGAGLFRETLMAVDQCPTHPSRHLELEQLDPVSRRA